MYFILLTYRPSLLHSFTPGSKPNFSTNPSHRRFLLPTGLPHDNGTGPITLIILFLVSHFNFLFVPCGALSWLPVSFLLHVKYTLSYRIVSYRIVLCYTVLSEGTDTPSSLQQPSNILNTYKQCSYLVSVACSGYRAIYIFVYLYFSFLASVFRKSSVPRLCVFFISC